MVNKILKFFVFTSFLTIAFSSQGQSDFCVSATSITPSFTYCNSQVGSSANATESMASCSASGNADDDVWYDFVANSNQMTIRVDPSVGYDPVLEFFSGSCGSLTSIQCEDVNGVNGPEIIQATGLTIGNTYSFRIYHYGVGAGTSTFEVCVFGLAPPSNDAACNAFLMPEVTPSCNFFTFTNMGSTGSSVASPPVGSCGGSGTQQGGYVGGDVWFSVIVPASGELDVHTQAIDFSDGAMALYSGSCNAPVFVACDDDGQPGDGILMPHIYQTGLIPGDTMFVRVWEHSNVNSGQFGICVTTPVNDDCVNAQWICDLNGYGGVTSSAYTIDNPDNMCGIGDPINPTVGCVFGTGYTGASAVQLDNNSWLQFTANATTAELFVEISSCQNNNGMQMQIFGGSNCSNFVPVSNFLETATSQTVLATGLTVGETYYIVIDGFAGDICAYTITATTGIQVAEATASDNNICLGDSTELTAVVYGTGSHTYTWTDDDNNFISSAQSLFVTPATSTEYNLEVSGFCGTTTSASVLIVVTDTPTINAGVDFSMCDNDSAQLNAVASQGTGAYTYTWNNGLGQGATKTISPNSSTIYSVSVVDALGCASSDEIAVTVNAAPVAYAGEDVIACDNDTTILTATGGGNYYWSTTETSASISVSPSVSTNYQVVVDNVLCSDSDMVSITVYPTYNDTVQVSICDNKTHTLEDNSVVSAAGFYPLSYSSVNTCDSVYVTELIVNPTYNDTVQVSICDNETHTLEDNSIVSAAGFYPLNYSTVNICDSVYVTELIVNPTYNDTVQVSICDNETHTLEDNSVVSTAGFYPLSYSTVNTCDSVYVTELIVNPTYNDTVQVSICDNETHTLEDNSVVSVAGFYPLSYSTVNTCDSVYVTELIVNSTYNDTVQVSICDNETHTLEDNSVVSLAGFYPLSYSTVNTCDSVYVTELIVNPTYNDTVQVSICDNETHTLEDNSVVSTAGFYPLSYSTVNTCDSVYVTELIVNPTYNDTIQVSICDNETHTLEDNSVVSVAGFYPLSYSTVSTCDSVYVTELIVNPTFNDTIQVSICDNETHTLEDNSVVSVAGFYLLSYSTMNTCDSVYVTELIVNSTYNDTVQVSICDNETHTLEDNSVVSVAGFYPLSYSTVNTCDSVYVTELILNPTYNDTVQDTFCENTSYYLPNGDVVDVPGAYDVEFASSFGCDSIITYELSVVETYSYTVDTAIGSGSDGYLLPDGLRVTEEGRYLSELMSAFGCDSLIITNLVVIEEWGIPNAFSPNALQNENAVFTIVNEHSLVKVSMLQIYNRWGEKVFDNNESGLDYWDGYYNGKLQNAGNYAYILKVINSQGEESKIHAGNFLMFW